jgi:hypothetical protein
MSQNLKIWLDTKLFFSCKTDRKTASRVLSPFLRLDRTIVIKAKWLDSFMFKSSVSHHHYRANAGRVIANLGQYSMAIYQLAFPQDAIIYPRVLLTLSSLVVVSNFVDLTIEANFPRHHGPAEED